MLPPVLEIYVVWHPGDKAGKLIAEEFVRHFRGASFSGVIGGGVHVSARSYGWTSITDAPQPIYTARSPAPNGLTAARYVAIVPLLGNQLAKAVQQEGSPWHAYVSGFSALAIDTSTGIFPYLLNSEAMDGTILSDLLGAYQQIAAGDATASQETVSSLRTRDLTQSIAQHLSPVDEERLRVFISHTKHGFFPDGSEVQTLVQAVRRGIAQTRLADFFDARDLQPGKDWAAELEANAANSALLSIRTDLYASRDWCQREVSIAKRSGMPVVTIDAIGRGEQRGSFLLDHVPRVPVRQSNDNWNQNDIMRGLNLLVDECLKRVIWLRQQELAIEVADLGISWWASHAPEPLTLQDWIDQIDENSDLPPDGGAFRIMHPDPPLGTEERRVLDSMMRASRFKRPLDIMTPRMLAARGV